MNSIAANAGHLAWIALGSNIDPARHLPVAVRHLAQLGQVRRVSSVWQSSPVGDLLQADFCNGAALLETGEELFSLKTKLLEIETLLGRVRDPLNKNAARTLDLDIAMYDQLVLHSDRCQLPDPEILTRPFLAVPLAELDPDFCHPQTGLSLQEIATRSGGTVTLQQRHDIQLDQFIQ